MSSCGAAFAPCLPRRQPPKAPPAAKAAEAVAAQRPQTAGRVEVVELAKEWCELEDPDLDNGEEQFKQVATISHRARERRLTAGREALALAEETGTPLGDADVEIMEQQHEWGQIDEDDSEEEEQEAKVERRHSRHAVDAFQSRERRLTAGAEAIKLAVQQGSPLGGDRDVDVVLQACEWGEQPADSDDDAVECSKRRSHASVARMARERRLTAGAEAIAMASQQLPAGAAAAEQSVTVVAEGREWQELEEDSDDEDGGGGAAVAEQRCRRASDAHKARERRLTVGAEALLVAPLALGPVACGQDVVVTEESKEWGEVEDSDADEPAEDHLKTDLNRHATGAHCARERRLTAGAEALSVASMLPEALGGTRAVEVVTDAKEWEEAEDDSDKDSCTEDHFRHHASGSHAARERRLTAGAEALTMAASQLPRPSEGQQPVAVVANAKEWQELEEDSDNEGAAKEQLSRHATSAHVARERRLTAGAEAIAFALQQPPALEVAAKDVAVVAQTKEWEEAEDDSDKECGTEDHFRHHASSSHAARERRLTAGAEALAIVSQLPRPSGGQQPVAVVANAKEWQELEEDSDNEGAAKEQLSRHATSAHVARERRLTAGAEAIAFALQQPPALEAAAKDVAVVAQTKEWEEAEDDSDKDSDTEDHFRHHASGSHAARERRLTAGAEALTIASKLPRPSEGHQPVAVVTNAKEWQELEEDSDNEGAAKEQLSRHATDAHVARERRLTAGAEAIAFVLQQPPALEVAARDVAVVAQTKEWDELEGDSEEENVVEDKLCRHATDARKARERRLTVGAEALSFAPEPR